MNPHTWATRECFHSSWDKRFLIFAHVGVQFNFTYYLSTLIHENANSLFQNYLKLLMISWNPLIDQPENIFMILESKVIQTYAYVGIQTNFTLYLSTFNPENSFFLLKTPQNSPKFPETP